jgi:hypothetical protein
MSRIRPGRLVNRSNGRGDEAESSPVGARNIKVPFSGKTGSREREKASLFSPPGVQPEDYLSQQFRRPLSKGFYMFMNI